MPGVLLGPGVGRAPIKKGFNFGVQTTRTPTMHPLTTNLTAEGVFGARRQMLRLQAQMRARSTWLRSAGQAPGRLKTDPSPLLGRSML
mmetsp:Transcript_108258/g.290694  ORF Transcript_108258/g.290694 Transcript_108258/m.290694 type:complete len:88 (+) Transcript_108258:1478-1741(+)